MEDVKNVHAKEEEEKEDENVNAKVLRAAEAQRIAKAPAGGNKDEAKELAAVNAVRGRVAADIALLLLQLSNETRAAFVN